MSMEISGSYGQYKANYAERVRAEQGQIKEIQGRKEEALDKNPIQDEYISSEKSATKPTGLYRLGQDENGNRKVFFDNPEKTEGADEKGQPKIGKLRN